MRTGEEIAADADQRSPFSNSTEYEIWANNGRACYDCRNDSMGDDPEPEPEPPPVIDGQIDIFEVFVDQVVDRLPEPARSA
jgi:hypothetical protein